MEETMKHIPLLQAGAITALIAFLVPIAIHADDYDKKTIITLDQPTEVPGIVLQPGRYVLKLVDSTSTRHIVEIMNEKMDHLYALTFTTAATKVQQKGKTVLTFYEGTQGRPQALRRWFWPGDLNGQEFLYPKNQAGEIAARTKENVPEGDLPTVKESGQTLIPDNAKGSSANSR
jgi:hypothetical protein